MAEIYTVSKEINGKTYVCQFNGIAAAQEALDSSYIDGSNNMSSEKLAKYLFENVVVEPKGLTPDDFGADKIGSEKTKTVNGVEYTAKFNGISCALKAIDSTYIDGTSNTSNVKFSKYIFDNVITKPEKLSLDDFDNTEDLNEVISFARDVMQGVETMEEYLEVFGFARDVMQGKFRDKKDKKPTKTTSKG